MGKDCQIWTHLIAYSHTTLETKTNKTHFPNPPQVAINTQVLSFTISYSETNRNFKIELLSFPLKIKSSSHNLIYTVIFLCYY